MALPSERILVKRTDQPRTRGVAQFAQRLSFNLADALASNGKSAADFFQRVGIAVFKAKTHTDDVLFARAQMLQHGSDIFLKAEVDGGVRGRGHRFIFNKVAEVGFFLFADWGLKGNGSLSNFAGAADLFNGYVHASGQLLGSRLAAKFLNELPGATSELVNDLDHVNRNADSAGLVSNRASDGLTNPPGGVSGEFISAAPIELVGSLHQAEIAFLNEIEELQAMMGIFFGNGDHEAKVG